MYKYFDIYIVSFNLFTHNLFIYFLSHHIYMKMYISSNICVYVYMYMYLMYIYI